MPPSTASSPAESGARVAKGREKGGSSGLSCLQPCHLQQHQVRAAKGRKWTPLSSSQQQHTVTESTAG